MAQITAMIARTATTSVATLASTPSTIFSSTHAAIAKTTRARTRIKSEGPDVDSGMLRILLLGMSARSIVDAAQMRVALGAADAPGVGFELDPHEAVAADLLLVAVSAGGDAAGGDDGAVGHAQDGR